MFVIWFSVKRSDGESRVNRQPLLFCIQSQEEEIQPEGMDVADRTTEVDQRTGGPNPGILIIPIARRSSSVGSAGRSGTIKISARVHRRTMRRRQRQMLLPPQEEMMR